VPVFFGAAGFFGESTFGSSLAKVVGSGGVWSVQELYSKLGLTAENSFAGRGEKGF
jgi:hypothetical protein